MWRYAARRVLLILPVVVGLSILTFAIARMLPGDPVQLAAGPQASTAEIEALRTELGLDRPIVTQYWTYATGLLHGDWGESILTRRAVADDLRIYLPASLELVIAAMGLAILFGVPIGMAAAAYRDRWPDYVSRVFALGAISMPRFFLALLLQLAFAMVLGWLPLSGRFPLTLDPPPILTGFLLIDALAAGQWGAFGIALEHMLMPAFAMSLSPLATITRMMRASMLEILQQDYVLAARALGLSERRILFKYVLKNAMSATLTVIGLYFGWLLAGTVLVETVFDWPGIGLYATKAILTQDFQPIVGVTLVIGLLFVTVNLLVDLAYGFLNPKVRYQ